MEQIKVLVGSVQSGSSGTVTRDTTREVVFQGEKLGDYHEPGIGRDGNPTDTRGTVETLYRAEDGRLIVHVRDWSHWQGEPTVYSLHEVTEADLQGDGRFAALGRECGYGRPLTLDEALAQEAERGVTVERMVDGELVRSTYRPKDGEPLTLGQPSDDNPRCWNCGKPLPESASPYSVQEGDAIFPRFLCEDCAGAYQETDD